MGQLEQKDAGRKKQKRVRPLLEPSVEAAAAGGSNGEALGNNVAADSTQLAVAAHAGNSKFARALGSVDYQTREKGLQALTRWLTRNAALSRHDMMKIWKGLFYCFWHSDKAPVQAELAMRLAKIMPALNDEAAFLFFDAFITTIRREWFGIDRLRLDKFMMLSRIFFRQLFEYLRAHKWQTKLVERYAQLLRSQVLLPSDTLHAVGFTFHVCDLLVPELCVVASAGNSQPVPAEALRALLEPFAAYMATAGEQSAINRAKSAVFEAVLEEVQAPAEGATTPLSQLDISWLAAHLFELGALPGIKARNREALYDASKHLEQLHRKRRRLNPSFAENLDVVPGGEHKAQAQTLQQKATAQQEWHQQELGSAAKAGVPEISDGAARAPLAESKTLQSDAPPDAAGRKTKRQRAAEGEVLGDWAAVPASAGLLGVEAVPVKTSQRPSPGAAAVPAANGVKPPNKRERMQMKKQRQLEELAGAVANVIAAKKGSAKAAAMLPQAAVSQPAPDAPAGSAAVVSAPLCKGVPGSGVQAGMPVDTRKAKELAVVQATKLQASAAAKTLPVEHADAMPVSTKKKKQKLKAAAVAAAASAPFTASELPATTAQAAPAPLSTTLGSSSTQQPALGPLAAAAAALNAKRSSRQRAEPSSGQANGAPSPASTPVGKMNSQQASYSAACPAASSCPAAGAPTGPHAELASNGKKRHKVAVEEPLAALYDNGTGIGNAAVAASHASSSKVPVTPPTSAKPAAAAAMAAAAAAAAAGRSPTSGSAAPTPSVKKGVRINLRKNLYFAVGGPKADPAVRTPPSSRGPGPILKKSSSVTRMAMSVPPKQAGGRSNAEQMPASAPRQHYGTHGERSEYGSVLPSQSMSPTNKPRVKAALFF